MLDEVPTTLDLNAVVAFNVRAIRLERGLTQDQVADRLAEYTGHRLPQASISHMERSFVDRRRRRLFSAHELYLLSKVFDVPIVYFFLPPPLCLDHTVANTGDSFRSLVDSVFGTPATLHAVDSRLVEVADPPLDADDGHSSLHSLSPADCDARLQEISSLLRELTARHRPTTASASRSTTQR